MSGMAGDPTHNDPWKRGIGGGAGGLSRLFGEGELWLRWGVPVGRVAGVVVRVHWVFIVLVVAGVIMTLPRHQSGIGFRLPALAALLVLSFLHEMARVFACRRVGGETDEIVLWPLGGLGEHHTPRDPRQELKSVLAGPTLHALLLPVFGLVLFAATRSWAVALPNPLDLGRSVYFLGGADGTVSWWVIVLWSFHAANIVLLLFNLLVPMHPSDAGSVLRCLLWKRVGYHRARWLSAHIGLGVACGMVLVGAVFADGKLLILVGAFGAAVCWAERRRIQFLAGEDPVLDAPPAPEPEDRSVPEQAEVDRILEKISEVGMEGLSGRERRVLKRATRESRETEGGPGDSDE